MSAGISAIRIPAKANHTASVIWLHGLGDTGQGWKFLSGYYDFPHVKWIFPHAPTIPITLNGGYRMPGWFNIYSLGDIQGKQDEDGMKDSVKTVHKLIKEEIDEGISSERIIVGGFSQGSAIAILAGYSYERKLAGVVGLSGWLPIYEKFLEMRNEANSKTPMFQAHGTDDMVVKFQYGLMTCEKLTELDIPVKFVKVDGMGHEADPDELLDLGKWLKERVGNPEGPAAKEGKKAKTDETDGKAKV